MGLNVGREVAAMMGMTLTELRAKHAEVFGEKTQSRHKDYILRRVAWRLQANESGNLSERARTRALELAQDSDVRLTAPRRKATPAPERTKVARIHLSHDNRLPMPGAILTREYQDKTIEVRVLPKGFEYAGEIYRTLSAVATAITGTHWNGYHFFGLGKKGNGNGRKK